MDFLDKQILVVGLARTGVALCRFLAALGARVTVTDVTPPAALAAPRRDIQDLGVREELGVAQPHWQEYDAIVLSPGVPPELPWLAAARTAGLPVIGELEVASHFITRPLIAVSGTNGKTTTTTLVGKLLATSGLRPLVGGNIGNPAISLLPQQEEADCLVLEVSSFQLDTAPSFHPQAAALLNITPDHLDRYSGFDAYVASKASLFHRQSGDDLQVLNADDAAVRALYRQGGRGYYFSTTRTLREGAWLKNGALQVKLFVEAAESFPLHAIMLRGRHNLENVMAALLLALDAGADPERCREVLASFRGLPHRLEWVTNVLGVEFYDDSKGTNVGAVAQSLAYFRQPVILIAGGRDKDSDFSSLSPLIRERVKALVLLGETREQLSRVWRGLAPVYPVVDMAEAVARAWELSQPGEAVLLSPACASFDMFTDYAHRGRTFQRLVRELQDAQGE